MLTKLQIIKYADVLLWGLKTARKETYKRGDKILIRFDLAALKLAEVLHKKILEMGMNPIMRPVISPVIEYDFYNLANKNQLAFTAPGQKELMENVNGNIFLRAPESLTHLSQIDPKKIGKAAVARKFLRDILNEREEQGKFGWTLCVSPTEELAKYAQLTPKEYTNQIIRACYLDKKDPVRAWKEIHKNAMTIKTWINSMDVKYYHITGNQIDLRIAPGKKRKWIGISGHNIPSFELFLSPDWHKTEGQYYANQPSFRNGNYVEGIHLFFKKGVLKEIKAKKGLQFVQQQLAMDRGASRLGEFSLTDKRFSRINKFMANTLFDENYGGRYGNCHIAMGSSYTDTYDGDPTELTKEIKNTLGFNDSALHWDLVNTEEKIVQAELTDGKKVIIYEKGQFKY